MGAGKGKCEVLREVGSGNLHIYYQLRFLQATHTGWGNIHGATNQGAKNGVSGLRFSRPIICKFLTILAPNSISPLGSIVLVGDHSPRNPWCYAEHYCPEPCGPLGCMKIILYNNGDLNSVLRCQNIQTFSKVCHKAITTTKNWNALPRTTHHAQIHPHQFMCSGLPQLHPRHT